MSELPVMITLDPGWSDTKIIWRVTPFRSELLMMSPEVKSVPRELIDSYKSKRRLTIPDPENEAWVECEGCYYVVGFLAQEHFKARVVTHELKYELAIVKVLAAVGVIALKEGLTECFNLALAVPLPYSQWENRDIFEQDLRKALTRFSFFDKPLSVNLSVFVCVPEGGGHMLARGEKIGAAISQMKVVTLMFGYRDISIVCFNRGVPSGYSEPIGLEEMLRLVQGRTSGHTSRERERKLLESIHRAGKNMNTKNFSHLALSKKAERKAEDINRMTEAVKISRSEYWGIVESFLLGNIPPDVDEIILGGGASEYLQPELQKLLAQNFGYARICWSAELEEDVRSSFSLSPSNKSLCIRLTDAYALSNFLRQQVCPAPNSTRELV